MACHSKQLWKPLDIIGSNKETTKSIYSNYQNTAEGSTQQKSKYD